MKVGVVYAPILDQMFTVVKGQGAYCNGERMSTSKQTGTFCIYMNIFN